MTDLDHFELFTTLIKDGCQWQGDVMSKKWAEFLHIPDDYCLARVTGTIERRKLVAGTDYRMEPQGIWIA